MALTDKLTDIANAIREKTGEIDAIKLADMPNKINSIFDANIEIIGSTVQPEGKENLIWVNTSTPISSWVTSPSQPGNPTTDMVWIQNKTNEYGINILNKNAVEVFPSGCKQYINGKWVGM